MLLPHLFSPTPPSPPLLATSLPFHLSFPILTLPLHPQKFYSPNILSVASSLVGEDSLSHHVDPAIGVYIIDRSGTYLCLNSSLGILPFL